MGTESEEKNCERSGNFGSIKKISSNAAGPLHERKKGIAGGLNDNPDIICKIASLYEKNQDTNVASADTMKEAVKQVLKKEGVWK